MIRHRTGTAIAFLLAAALTAAAMSPAGAADAVANFAATDPATGKTGTAQVTARAIVTENPGIQYATPIKLGLSVDPGDTSSHRVRVWNADGRMEGSHDALPLSPTMAVRGPPNQAFAVSIEQAPRGINGPDSSMIAGFTHNAEQTPRIGPAGDIQLMIGATLRPERNMVRRGYGDTLYLIVSHN